MPRKPRLHVDGGFYHVILRGNHRQTIFFTPADRTLFAELVAENIERFGMRVHAFCWMSNHVHLLMQVGSLPLAKAMMRIAGRFARHMQRSLRTTGHFFERRYRTILVDADEYLLELVRYIHLNPVRAGIVRDAGEHSWSGHLCYLGQQETPWLTTDFVLSMFASDLTAARAAYWRFVQAGVTETTDIRQLSLGNPDDGRILGSDRFVEALPIKLPRRCLLSIEQISAAVCGSHGIEPAQLASRSRIRALALIRSLVVHSVLHHRIASLSDLARYFHRSASALHQSLEYWRRRKPELFADVISLSSE